MKMKQYINIMIINIRTKSFSVNKKIKTIVIDLDEY